MTIEDRRLRLHEDLCELLGSRNVYYDPPADTEITYPAFVYEKSSIDMVKADNVNYLNKVAYIVKLIRKDDNDDVLDRALEMPYTKFNRSYVIDSMHHDVIITYV